MYIWYVHIVYKSLHICLFIVANRASGTASLHALIDCKRRTTVTTNVIPLCECQIESKNVKTHTHACTHLWQNAHASAANKTKCTGVATTRRPLRKKFNTTDGVVVGGVIIAIVVADITNIANGSCFVSTRIEVIERRTLQDCPFPP